MSKLVVKFPTRNRPEKFKTVFTRYLTFLSGKHTVQFVISMDKDDSSMNCRSIKRWLNTRAKNALVSWNYGQSKSKIEACNADLENVEGDVLLLASDDMVPIRQGYDQIIFDVFAEKFPNFDGAVRFWDGKRKRSDPLMTLPVIGLPLYRQFGYVYHPAYRSVYCDNEQTEVFSNMAKLVIDPRCIIEHQWKPGAWDELHARNESREVYKLDKKTFEERQSLGFPKEVGFDVSV